MIKIACLVYDGCQLLDIAGPLAVFEVAGHQGSGDYATSMISATSGPVRTSGGVEVFAGSASDNPDFDMLLIPGGLGARNPEHYALLLPIVKQAAVEGRRIVSVSSAAFILAEAGLLDDHRTITHWGAALAFSARYPEVNVDTQVLYSRERNIWTSAGSTAGVDLALAIVEEDFGAAAAANIAEALLLPFRRTGAHSQVSPMLTISPSERFNELLAWVRQNLAGDLSIERLADRTALSIRQFTRAFRNATGMSAAKYVEALRLERAKGLIESSAASLDEIAFQCGFENSERMRRAFLRTIVSTPRELRRARKSSFSSSPQKGRE